MDVDARCQEKSEDCRADIERVLELLSTYASDVLTARLLEETTGGELTPAQLEALIFIHRHDGCSVKDLSEGLHISIPSSTRLVDRLVRKSLVDRRESGVDRRLVQMTVTPVGVVALKAVRTARLARVEEALAPFAPTERTHLLVVLERFVRAALRDVETVEVCCRHCGNDHDRSCVVNTAHLALAGRPIDHA